MGMYSEIRYCDLKITNVEGLKKFKKQLTKKGYKHFANAIKTEDGYLHLDIGGKIIGYWYYGFVQFLKLLAYFVEGVIELDYETREQAANIRFKDNKCIIELGLMEWSTIDAKTMLEKDEKYPISKDRKEEHKEYKKVFESIFDELKDDIIVNEL